MAERTPRWALVVVRGRSMEPTLHDGDRLFVRWLRRVPGEGDGPAPGRIVVVRMPGDGTVAVKRLLMRRPEGWWVERDSPTEGRDSWQPDVGAVAEDGLLGVVHARVWPRPRLLRAKPPAPPATEAEAASGQPPSEP